MLHPESILREHWGHPHPRHQGRLGGCAAGWEHRPLQAAWLRCEFPASASRMHCDESSLGEGGGIGGNKGGRKEKGGQLRTAPLYCSFPNEMANLSEVLRGCVWHESASSTIYCQLIKLAFVISQKGRGEGVMCRDRWRMKKIFFMPFELFMAWNFTC